MGYRVPMEKRFWPKVDKSGDCWVWTAYRTPLGYGQVSVTNTPEHRSNLAHRVAWELCIGPIPPGMVLDHLCRNTSCVRPSHLEPVTPGENSRRGIPAILRGWSTEACPSGHSYAEHGWQRSNGHYNCRPCNRERQREYRQRLAAKHAPQALPRMG